MTFDDFKNSLGNDVPPDDINEPLKALWQDGKNDWDTAHQIAQSIDNSDGAWVHAYLHRKEGDVGNASYWYSRAGRKMPNSTLEEEWEALVKEFL